MKRFPALILAAALGALPLLLAGCTRPASSTYAIVFKNSGNPYGLTQLDGFKKGIEEQGFEAVLRAPSEPTAEGQIRIIDQLIRERAASICIVGNDYDALQPVLIKARKAGIKVFSLDSAVNPASRLVHVNQADSEKVGQTLVHAAYNLCGGRGEVAILSATRMASNQNLWIDYMKKELAKPEYAGMTLVQISYGDDIVETSLAEAGKLLASFPALKVVIAPTTVGIAAAGKVISDRGLRGKVLLTGLGLPSQMAPYIRDGICPYMFLWNPENLGYLGAYTATALVSAKITGRPGDRFSAGRLGEYTVVKAADGGTEILLGPPQKFDADNIEEWAGAF